jgi:hypothetical protein
MAIPNPFSHVAVLRRPAVALGWRPCRVGRNDRSAHHSHRKWRSGSSCQRRCPDGFAWWGRESGRKIEQGPVVDELGIEHDLDGLGMRAMIGVGRVGDIAAAIADAGRDDAMHFADQILHAPKAAAGQNRALR